MKSAIPAGIAGLICILVGINSYHQGDTSLYLCTLLLDGALYLLATFSMLQGSKDGYATAILASKMLFFPSILRVTLGFPRIMPVAMSGLALLSGGYYNTAATKSPDFAAVIGLFSLANGVHSYFFRGGTLINIIAFTAVGILYLLCAWQIYEGIKLINLGANNNYNNYDYAWKYNAGIKLTRTASQILSFYAGTNTASGYPDNTYPVFLMLGGLSGLYYRWGSEVNGRPATNPATPTPAPAPVDPVPAPASIAVTQ